MKHQKSTLLLILLLNVFYSCSFITGEEITRLPINQISIDDNNIFSKKTSLDLAKGEKIALWSDMDMEYAGEVQLLFKIRMSRNGENMGIIELDPTSKNLTIGELKSQINDNTSWSFSGKNTEITIEDDGNYTFEGILVASENPSLKINKAEVVFRK